MGSDGWGPNSRSGVADFQRSSRRPNGFDRATWWRLNGHVRLYGLILLIGTKTADVFPTAVGLHYVPGIVEMNPFAEAMFGDAGLLAGLTVSSFATIVTVTLIAEWLADTVYRRLEMARFAILSKTILYGVLSAFFGSIAVRNGLLISQRVQSNLADLVVRTSPRPDIRPRE